MRCGVLCRSTIYVVCFSISRFQTNLTERGCHEEVYRTSKQSFVATWFWSGGAGPDGNKMSPLPRAFDAKPWNRAKCCQTYYASSSAGLDTYDGLYPDHSLGGIHGPWKTIAKVDSESLVPGDSVLFKRGDTWRDCQLLPKSGSAGGAPSRTEHYGTRRAKPLLLGSVEQDNTTDWTNIGGNIWSTIPAVQLVTTSGNKSDYQRHIRIQRQRLDGFSTSLRPVHLLTVDIRRTTRVPGRRAIA